MFILGISGKRGAGKDLLANILHYRGFRNFAFAGVLKDKVRQELNLTKEQTDGKLKETATKFTRKIVVGDFHGQPIEEANNWTPREIMIEYGKFYRQFDQLFWVKKVFESLKVLPDTSLITISDVRFKNEADYIKEQGGKLIRLERDPKLNIYKTELTDLSETELDNYSGFDFVVPQEHNQNPQDLEKIADKITFIYKKESNAAKTL